MLNTNSTHDRLPYFDAVRAIAAVMGIMLHTGAGYLKYPIPEWPHFSNHSSIFFDYLSGTIHLFRVPVFFFLAGFFSLQLLQKLNYDGFTKNRLQRIALPFLLFSLIFNFPLLLSRIVFNKIHSFADFIHTFQNLSYLWFLEYLLIYYAAQIFLCYIFTLLKINTHLVDQVMTKYLSSKFTGLAMVSLTFTCLYQAGVWYTPILLAYTPNASLLIIYGLYFLLGIAVNKYQYVERFFIFKWPTIFSIVISFALYSYLILNKPHTEHYRVIGIALYSLSSYLLFKFFVALCVKFFRKQNNLLQLLSKASYWIYLSNVFIIVMVQKLSAKFFASIFLQFGFICMTTIVLSLITYQLYSKNKLLLDK